ncbi:WbuC family cupin fold metalloprotein [Chitinilyticum litopenaei]|uniref:WbuC family cupin fold metalloprotein n=1 Tax=Chitinilyticum litopenaei TaxID=1121276 RepID=UPI00042351C6|nr:WbuC family cupin fold metalloprotein [Chitinilyticum litopenaei]
MSLVDRDLLAALNVRAGESPRGRTHHNLHASLDDLCHRLLIAIEPGCYVAPHRHRDPQKAELLLALAGELGVVLFDEQGAISAVHRLAPGGPLMAIDIPAGQFHAVLALARGTIFLECKAGPYVPPAGDEWGCWAPREGDAAVADYRRELQALFGGW